MIGHVQTPSMLCFHNLEIILNNKQKKMILSHKLLADEKVDQQSLDDIQAMINKRNEPYVL